MGLLVQKGKKNFAIKVSWKRERVQGKGKRIKQKVDFVESPFFLTPPTAKIYEPIVKSVYFSP